VGFALLFVSSERTLRLALVVREEDEIDTFRSLFGLFMAGRDKTVRDGIP
jgi:hypothetical protein